MLSLFTYSEMKQTTAFQEPKTRQFLFLKTASLQMTETNRGSPFFVYLFGGYVFPFYFSRGSGAGALPRLLFCNIGRTLVLGDSESHQNPWSKLSSEKSTSRSIQIYVF